MAKTFEECRQYFAHDVSNIPKDMVVGAIRFAVIEFCEQVRSVRLDATVIDVTATAEFDIPFAVAYYSPVEIGAAYLGDGSDDDTKIRVYNKRELDMYCVDWNIRTTTGDPYACCLMKNGKVRVYPIPDSDIDDNLYLKDVAVKPTLTGASIEDFVYNNHILDIRNGALAELLNMKGQDWYDPKRADKYGYEFAKAIADGKGENLQGVATYAGSTMF